MTKKVKIALLGAGILLSGAGAYMTSGKYGVQDNNMVLANVEALTGDGEENQEGGDGQGGSGSGAAICIGVNTELRDGVDFYSCGYMYKEYTGTYNMTIVEAYELSAPRCYLTNNVVKLPYLDVFNVSGLLQQPVWNLGAGANKYPN